MTTDLGSSSVAWRSDRYHGIRNLGSRPDFETQNSAVLGQSCFLKITHSFLPVKSIILHELSNFLKLFDN
jgi:hypothetical protein